MISCPFPIGCMGVCYEEGWGDVTTSVDTSTNTICGVTGDEEYEYGPFIVVHPIADNDGDGFTTVGDCDDGDRNIFPGAAELCDGKDNNCDGQIDEGLSTDNDGDGHYTPGSCASPADDCADNYRNRYGGRQEICDGVDND